jgi:adenylate kinase
VLYIILLGPPGAGKGTQAKLLVDSLKLAYLSTGDLFRQNLKDGTSLGLKAKQYMERGELVPDEITTQMVLEWLAKMGKEKSCLLDGYPRNQNQAEALDKALSKDKRHIDKVLNIIVSEDELVRRLSGRLICRNCQTPYNLESAPPKVAGKCDHCGGEVYRRKDDEPEVVRQRIKVYNTQTAPLIDYYKEKGILVDITSVGGIESVHRRMKAALKGN